MAIKERLFFFVILAGVSLLTLSDIIADYSEGSSMDHIATEGVMFLLSITGLGVLMKELFDARGTSRVIAQNLKKTEADLEKWRRDAQKYLKGLSQAIENQFNRWKFTPAEKEIGFLLLKGLAFKEIADVRNTSERTVRQQSLEIYKKSGLGGRVELSAFFLEDLLPPALSEKLE